MTRSQGNKADNLYTANTSGTYTICDICFVERWSLMYRCICLYDLWLKQCIYMIGSDVVVYWGLVTLLVLRRTLEFTGMKSVDKI